VTYSEFINWVQNNELDLHETARFLGYSKSSISNNWSKNNEVPKKAEIAFKLFLELKMEKQKKQINESNQDSTLSCNISSKALKIANNKCLENDIELDDYLSSLILANI